MSGNRVVPHLRHLRRVDSVSCPQEATEPAGIAQLMQARRERYPLPTRGLAPPACNKGLTKRGGIYFRCPPKMEGMCQVVKIWVWLLLTHLNLCQSWSSVLCIGATRDAALPGQDGGLGGRPKDLRRAMRSSPPFSETLPSSPLMVYKAYALSEQICPLLPYSLRVWFVVPLGNTHMLLAEVRVRWAIFAALLLMFAVGP